jgi:hypothetical protein
MKLSNFASTLAICALAVPLFAASGNPAVSREEVHYTKAELAHLVQEARTPEQYRALAVYFEHRKASYQDQAAQMKREWERRSQNVVGPAAKYPRPVDSAKNLYEYYDYDADQAGVLEAKYEHLSGSGDLASGNQNQNR